MKLWACYRNCNWLFIFCLVLRYGNFGFSHPLFWLLFSLQIRDVWAWILVTGSRNFLIPAFGWGIVMVPDCAFGSFDLAPISAVLFRFNSGSVVFQTLVLFSYYNAGWIYSALWLLVWASHVVSFELIVHFHLFSFVKQNRVFRTYLKYVRKRTEPL